MRKYWILIIFTFLIIRANGQTAVLRNSLKRYFANYTPVEQKLLPKPRLKNLNVNTKEGKINIEATSNFAEQSFTPETVDKIYSDILRLLPKAYRKYTVELSVNGYPIEILVPNNISTMYDPTRTWQDITYDGKPWVSNVSAPIDITEGLSNRHISLWASHGMIYDWNKGTWKWQRPKLFGTTEDLFTPTIVVPYLIPMLENAGAVVFTPRERDIQKNEIIVDNNDRQQGVRYLEVNVNNHWQTTDINGFANHGGTYLDGENPFQAGTSRMAKATSKKGQYSMISYQPTFKEEGKYAIYVSYQTLKNSIDDAQYIVWHKGIPTEYRVNQQMGGGTWVYLGTHEFDKGCNEQNRVVLTNLSNSKGVVTADAVRFGGGVGNIEREGHTSGMPRALEGARYYAQWAGMPYDIYSSRNGTDDYSDDINTRSFMTNYIGGGSCYMPDTTGLKVPIELSLGIHSDAGYAKDGMGLIGSLSICTTGHKDGWLNSGISRLSSRDFADALLTNACADIVNKYGKWNKRQIYDRNYSESRMPEVPSAIFEMLSHQNFPDMRFGQDPNFKFTLARSIYKTILKYVCEQHNEKYTITPLAPDNFRIEMGNNGKAVLRWDATTDPFEETAKATGYIVYTSCDSTGFDNGIYIKGETKYEINLEPNKLYSFRVVAANKGGKSFPTELLCASYNPEAIKNVIIINGFHRLAAPEVRHSETEQGFDFDKDPGLTLGPTAGWVGRQVNFDTTVMGKEDETGLGWSNNDFTGMIIAGNNQDYVRTHAEAIFSASKYNIVSCSSKAVEKGMVDLSKYQMADVVLGAERNDGYSLVEYKTFTPLMQQMLKIYTSNGGNLLVSGTHVASDMANDAESAFIGNILKCRFAGDNNSYSESVEGMGTKIQFYRTINEKHYAAYSPDNLTALGNAFPVLRYNDGYDAAVAYKGNDYRTFTMGFPFECIKDTQKQHSMMRGILNFLLE